MTRPVGVILAGGRGSRMGVLGESYPKTLLPVANEPLIAHHLRLLRRLEIRDVYVLVGYRASQVAAAIGDGERFGLRVQYVDQEAPLGSAHALGRLRPYVRGPFVALLGDYYFVATEPERLVRRLLGDGASAMAAKREPEARLVREACALTVDDDGRVLAIVEKPVAPATDLKGCGFYALRPEFFDAVARTPRTALRDEYELSVALELYVGAGYPLYAEQVLSWDANLTRPEDLLDCNLTWLERQGRDSLISESASVAPAVRLSRAVIGGQARVTGADSLEEVVVFPGSELAVEGAIRRTLVTPGELLPCGRTANSF